MAKRRRGKRLDALERGRIGGVPGDHGAASRRFKEPVGVREFRLNPAEGSGDDLEALVRKESGQLRGEGLEPRPCLGSAAAVVVEFDVKRKKSDFDLIHCVSPVFIKIRIKVDPSERRPQFGRCVMYAGGRSGKRPASVCLIFLFIEFRGVGARIDRQAGGKERRRLAQGGEGSASPPCQDSCAERRSVGFAEAADAPVGKDRGDEASASMLSSEGE